MKNVGVEEGAATVSRPQRQWWPQRSVLVCGQGFARAGGASALNRRREGVEGELGVELPGEGCLGVDSVAGSRLSAAWQVGEEWGRVAAHRDHREANFEETGGGQGGFGPIAAKWPAMWRHRRTARP